MATWRVRTILRSFADLPDDFSCDGAFASSTRIADQVDGSATAQVDMTIETDTLKDALTRAIDLNETLQDRIAYLSFAPAESAIVSVAPPTATYGQPFEIAVPVPGFRRDRTALSASDIAALDPESPEEAETALRLLRRGVNARLPFDSFMDLWSGIEALANAAAIEANDYIRSQCPACGAEIKGGPASHQQIRRMYQEGIPADSAAKAPKKLADEARTVRGSLAHGGRRHTSDFLDQVSEKCLGLQSVLVSSLSACLPVLPVAGSCPRAGAQWGLLTISVPGPVTAEINVTPREFECGFGLATLPSDRHQGQSVEAKFGLFLPLPIHALALPDFAPSA